MTDSSITGLDEVSTVSLTDVLPIDNTVGGTTNTRKIELGSVRGNVYHIEDFGGSPAASGATNTTALQAAIDAATNGTVLFATSGTYTISGSISLEAASGVTVDLGGNTLSYTGAAGTYLFDMTQAGYCSVINGLIEGDDDNHFVKTEGSAAAQATTYPTVPAASEWSHDLRFQNLWISAFDTVWDFGNFTREVWIDKCHVTGNLLALNGVGKVVSVFVDDSLLYSALASSLAVKIRGDSGDTAWRYAEGWLFSDVICDTQGVAVDLQDIFVFKMNGGQIKSASGVIGLDVNKGVTPLTLSVFLSDVLMNASLRVGNGLASGFNFQFRGSNLVFDSVAGTAMVVGDYAKNVAVSGATFDGGTGTARMFTVGANCVNISLLGLRPDTAEYTNLPTIDSTSASAVEAEFAGSWTPAVAFGGSSTGVTYGTQTGKFYYCGGHIEGYAEITLTSKGVQTGAATITGLPYTCNLVNGTGTVGKYSGFNTDFTPILEVTKTTTTLAVKTGGAGSEVAFTDVDFSNTSVINFSFSYPVAA